MFRLDIRDGFYLKLLEERHAPAIFALVNRDRKYLRKWLPWVDLTKQVDDTQKFVKITLAQFANNEGLTAGIWRGNEFAGTIGTHKIDWLNRKVEIGYWLGSKFQGQGIVTQACRLLTDHAFNEWDLNRVEIHCAPGNKKSCAIPKRLGFELEGVLRKAQLVSGKYLDANVYAMLARDWKGVTMGLRPTKANEDAE
jgi:ribosomal-protein-serine acetyltransferase